MNWNIFKRLRTVETDHSNTDISLEVLLKRVYAADARIEDLTRSIAGLNARVETQAGILGVTLGDIARDRNDLLKQMSALVKHTDAAIKEGLTRSIAELNARVETQTLRLGEAFGNIAQDRRNLLKRLSLLEKNLNPPLTDAEKLAKLKAYRKAYYRKNKAAKAALKDPK